MLAELRTQKDLKDFLKEHNQKAYEVYCKLRSENPKKTFFDVHRFAEEIGISFCFLPPKECPLVQDLDEKTLGKLAGILYQNKIWLNPTVDTALIRFTIAHLVGHYIYSGDDIEDLEEFQTGVLFHDQDRIFDAYTPEEIEEEMFMDSFAYILLIDEEQLKERLETILLILSLKRDSWRIFSILGVVFGVSRKAVKIRYNRLKFSGVNNEEIANDDITASTTSDDDVRSTKKSGGFWSFSKRRYNQTPYSRTTSRSRT